MELSPPARSLAECCVTAHLCFRTPEHVFYKKTMSKRMDGSNGVPQKMGDPSPFSKPPLPYLPLGSCQLAAPPLYTSSPASTLWPSHDPGASGTHGPKAGWPGGPPCPPLRHGCGSGHPGPLTSITDKHVTHKPGGGEASHTNSISKGDHRRCCGKSWGSRVVVRVVLTPLVPHSLCCQESDTQMSPTALPHTTATSTGQTTSRRLSDALRCPLRDRTAGELELARGQPGTYLKPGLTNYRNLGK